MALVFIHGWYQHGADAWGKLLPLLKDKYRLFVPDLPGHGSSRLRKPDSFSVEANTTLILNYIHYVKKHHKCRKVILIGHSYGAFAALNVVAKKPDELAAVVGLAAIDDYAPYTHRLKRVLAARIFSTGLLYRLQALFGLFPYGDRMLLYGKMSPELIPGRLAYAKIKNKTLAPESSQAYMRAFLDSRVNWPKEKIRTPALLVYGKRDQLTAAHWGEKILPHFSNAHVSVIAEAGHNVQISGAQVVSEQLKKFIEKSLRPRAKN